MTLVIQKLITVISLLADVLTFRKRQQPGRSTVLLVIIITARKRSLQRLCFYTCLSVILFTGGFCLSACWDGRAPRSRPPGSRHPLRSRHPPGPETPQEPESDTPQQQTPTPRSRCPPCAEHAGIYIQQPGGRQSYWNAYLFLRILVLFVEPLLFFLFSFFKII